MNLHNEIMNIPVQFKEGDFADRKEYLHYKEGHRDARHAAAELCIQAEYRMEQLMDYARSILCSSQYDELEAYMHKLENK